MTTAVATIVRLSAPEVARWLVHLNTVKRIPPTDLPYMRLGRRGDRRYRIEDVQAYVERRTVRS